ncbi:DUF5615 family PIN-like protein [Planotetraspora sp. GP83]|uniref:DUF5615 family PIN-like protein n=1 Tax=Planotetraspora sp. GP83 TaxID=3156264 RepID=UPI0035159C1C
MSGLLTDEMFPPLLAVTLRERGHDVVAIHERQGGAGLPDEQVLEIALAERRSLLTENVRDFEVLRAQRLTDGRRCPGLLYTNAVRFPRTKQALGKLVQALDEILTEQRLPEAGRVHWLR